MLAFVYRFGTAASCWNSINMNDEGSNGAILSGTLAVRRPSYTRRYLRAAQASIMCGLSRTHTQDAALLNFTPGAPLPLLHDIQKQITEQMYLGSQLKWQRELLVALWWLLGLHRPFKGRVATC